MIKCKFNKKQQQQQHKERQQTTKTILMSSTTTTKNRTTTTTTRTSTAKQKKSPKPTKIFLQQKKPLHNPVIQIRNFELSPTSPSYLLPPTTTRNIIIPKTKQKKEKCILY